MSEPVTIRPARAEDGAALAALYAPFVRETVVTFEVEPPDADEMAARVAATLAAGRPWLVAEDAGGRVVGYAYASAWKGRCAYRDVVESTVYVAREAHGRGLGRALMERLLADLAASGFHTVLAGIALPNDASVALHEALGYHQVGRLEEVGHKLGRRIDVGYWQRRLRGGDR